LRRTDSTDRDFSALVAALDADLRVRYGAGQDQYTPFNRIECATVIVAHGANDEPVGCGCFKVFAFDIVELKRMFVAASQRGGGIGRALVGALETWAGELGYTRVVLETGTLQHEAIAMYRACGYHEIANYGPYAGMPLSMCFSKDLVTGPRHSP
jgi:GNAT superfamily N-acetyltransferase